MSWFELAGPSGATARRSVRGVPVGAEKSRRPGRPSARPDAQDGAPDAEEALPGSLRRRALVRRVV